MYTPQVHSWDGQKDMVFRAAVSYTYKDSQKPDLGTVKVDSKTKVNMEDRLVIFSELMVSDSKRFIKYRRARPRTTSLT